MVAEYMMKLDLNDLGKAFLRVDEFVSNNQAYVGARPKGENEEWKRYDSMMWKKGRAANMLLIRLRNILLTLMITFYFDNKFFVYLLYAYYAIFNVRFSAKTLIAEYWNSR